MESIYDMDKRFELLEAQFNKQLEDINLKLAKANLDLEEQKSINHQIQGELFQMLTQKVLNLENKFNSQLYKISKANEELETKLLIQARQLEAMNKSLESKLMDQINQLEVDVIKTKNTLQLTEVNEKLEKQNSCSVYSKSKKFIINIPNLDESVELNEKELDLLNFCL